MAVAMAEAAQLPTDHIIKDTRIQATTPRPQDAHLDSTKIESLGTHRHIYIPPYNLIQQILKAAI